MEQETPDVNLLAPCGDRANCSPNDWLFVVAVVDPGDLHSVVIEQQAIHAPAPSAIKWHSSEDTSRQWLGLEGMTAEGGGRRSGPPGPERRDGWREVDLVATDQQQRQVFGAGRSQVVWSADQQRQSQMSASRHQLPSASPENHSHFHTQLQVERHQNKEITREIIEKETFEQEHKGFSKDSLATVSSADAGAVVASEQRSHSITPIRLTFTHSCGGADDQRSVYNQQQQQQHQYQYQYEQQQQQQQQQKQQQQHHHHQQQLQFQQRQQQVLIENQTIPSDSQKIQPCQATDGDEARFECQSRGEPQPTISWYRESRLTKPTNSYAIETDSERNKSTLNRNTVYTVKTENATGPAKSSNNMEEHSHGIWSVLSPLSPANQQQYDPSWLAYRKPDEDSVRADPLYRDLMMELQRLEEGVSQQASAPEPIVTPDCFQKPVFGQPIQPESVELEEHENVEFIARLIPNSDPTMRVEWTKNGRPLLESSRLTCEYEFGVVRLAIRRVEAEDSGIYQCRASNMLGEAVSRSKLLVHAKNSVQYDTLHPAGWDKIRQLENPRPVDYVEETPLQQPPKFLSHIQDYVEKDEGNSVHFECCLAPVDDPDMKTEWFFNGRPLVTGSRFHTIDDFGFIVLDIDWLFPRDTGEYICRATNKHGTSFTRTVLRVRPAKNIILDSQLDNATIDKLRQLEFPDVAEEVHVEEIDKPAHFVQPLHVAGNKRQFIEGDNVHFEARVGPATDGHLTVEWFHNDKPLISGHRFRPTFDFGHILLDILYVYPEDSGVYKCVAKNQQGECQSEVEIQVQGKQSIVYQSQLPREMLGGVDKITEMEAMWNRPPDPEEEEAPAERLAPQFVLKPKPCVAFEGSCARFCCRILAHPRPRVVWFINGQLVVSGSRYKLTHDGMYHLTIPKCLLSDAGKVEVRAKNLLGECACETELTVKRKVDDYRGVLKNSPNPWYDEATLKMYRRQRNHPEDEADDEDFEEFLLNFQKQQRKQQQLKIATELQTTSPQANQLIGYMEPETPDVNLLASFGDRANRSPLVEPGDLHPVVIEQQAIHAPAPSTIKWALEHTGEDISRQWPDLEGMATKGGGGRSGPPDPEQQDDSREVDLVATDQQLQQRQVFGVGRPQAASSASQQRQSQVSATRRQLPPASPENVEHGKEIHSHFHTQLQVERHQNKEITREIIEKETFEQEHKGFSKDSLATVSSADAGAVVASEQQNRSMTPIRLTVSHSGGGAGDQRSVYSQQQQQQQQQQHHQQQLQLQQQQQQVLIESQMIPPEFVQKIQPCQAIDGDEARFECQFRGEPQPTISWYRESRLIKPSNLYAIETDLEQNKSTLIVKRVTLNGNAVYTVKAENAAGSAKSSANLVVEAHPLPRSARGGQARQFDALEHLESGSLQQQQQYSFMSDVRGFASPTASDYDDSLTGELASIASRNSSLAGSGQQKIKSVRTRRLSPDELTSLIRASPDNLVAPTFLHTIHEVHAKLGDLARLDARLIGAQPMEVKWLRDGQRVRPDKQHKLLLEGDLYTLLILECSERDEGHYECVASNAVGEARCGASLRVSAEGRQSSTSSTSTYVMQSISGGGGGDGQSHGSWKASAELGPAVFSSSSSSAAVATTSATRSSSTAIVQQQQQQVSSSSQSAAISQQQSRQHFGLTKQPHHQLMSEYTSAGDGAQLAPAVPKLIKGLENQQVLEGKSVTLRCQISAFPKAEVAWFRQNDKQIKPSKYFRIFKDNDETHCLKILETFPEDQGEYKCVARAQHGQIETSAFISVLPSSPK